ncbi:MAG: GNAT family N-acetyltransferase [Actinomycetes bacterium]
MSINWRYTETLNPDERVAILGLFNRLDTSLGREAIDENRRRLVQHHLPGHYWVQFNGETPVGFANVDLTAHPSVEMAGGGFDGDLCELIALEHHSFDWWLRDTHDDHQSQNQVRALRYMECDDVHQHVNLPNIEIRGFSPEHDAERWLAQNNAAFASHPEQGTWDLDTLRVRITEPWFDPSGFLLLLSGDELVASCWTKIHEFNTVRTGEIYIISVHPNHQGQGLGAAALRVGLQSIHSRGVHRASLYVDDSNESAIAMYKKNGFRTVRMDRVLRITR